MTTDILCPAALGSLGPLDEVGRAGLDAVLLLFSACFTWAPWDHTALMLGDLRCSCLSKSSDYSQMLNSRLTIKL